MLLAGLSLSVNASWAQSNVIIYGNLDAGLYVSNKSWDAATNTNEGSRFAFTSSGLEPSYIGFLGQEDLGGGWKAKFKLESGISLANGGFDNSDGGIFGRYAYVGIGSDKYGEIHAGLDVAPFVWAVYYADPRSMYQFGSAITVYGDNTFTGIAALNAITYVSPKIYGFSARVMYVLGGVPGNFNAGRQYSAFLRYDYGGLSLIGAIEDASESSDTLLDNTLFQMPVEGRLLAAMYKFDDLTFKASFTNYKAPETFDYGLVGGGDNNIWTAGFDWMAVPTVDINAGVYYSRDPHNSQNHGVMSALGVQYLLSKRTRLYAQAGIANNHGRSVLGLESEGALQAGNGTTVGGIVGMIQRF
ncbi:porin [Paraburkholderia solitsugae]|nr:porin [Paraburkholderia solitsugae]